MSITLAAGKGTRMVSDLPKVLHLLLGAPLLEYGLEKVEQLGCEPRVVVVGYRREAVEAAFPDRGVTWAHQAEQLGTGHAANVGVEALGGREGDVLILNGDLPVLQQKTLEGLLARHRQSNADATILACVKADPYGYGRIIRDPANGRLQDIVEEKDADEDTRALREINVGVYVVRAGVFRECYQRIGRNNRQGEYYLTDVFVAAARAGRRVEVFVTEEEWEIAQVNDRREQAEVAKLLRRQILDAAMLSGVTIDDPDSTTIEKGVRIGKDTRILPFTYISRGVEIESGCEVGPFSYLRPGTHLRAGAHIGNFVEVKASDIGSRTKAKHLAYIGDAVVGTDVNIGAGSVFANFDGKKKSKTIVQDGAFIGSGTILVAPVSVGRGAVTGAGSVVPKNKNVPDGALVYGVPAVVRGPAASGSPAAQASEAPGAKAKARKPAASSTSSRRKTRTRA